MLGAEALAQTPQQRHKRHRTQYAPFDPCLGAGVRRSNCCAPSRETKPVRSAGPRSPAAPSESSGMVNWRGDYQDAVEGPLRLHSPAHRRRAGSRTLVISSSLSRAPARSCSACAIRSIVYTRPTSGAGSRGLIAAARANLQYLGERPALEQRLGHARDHIGLRDGLPETDWQRRGLRRRGLPVPRPRKYAAARCARARAPRDC